MNKNLARAKKFDTDHKVAIAVTATTIVLSAAHMAIIKQHNDFLADHDLLDTFYALED